METCTSRRCNWTDRTRFIIRNEIWVKRELQGFPSFSNFASTSLEKWNYLCLLTCWPCSNEIAEVNRCSSSKNNNEGVSEILTPCKTWKLSPLGCSSWSGSTSTLKTGKGKTESINSSVAPFKWAVCFRPFPTFDQFSWRRLSLIWFYRLLPPTEIILRIHIFISLWLLRLQIADLSAVWLWHVSGMLWKSMHQIAD